ncbi:MAG TPA: hypothetical protein DGT21_24940 [Armatimonadetes bacterium]|nr:hypothetical protein [Armatimonadota bacterium]
MPPDHTLAIAVLSALRLLRSPPRGQRAAVTILHQRVTGEVLLSPFGRSPGTHTGSWTGEDRHGRREDLGRGWGKSLPMCCEPVTAPDLMLNASGLAATLVSVSGACTVLQRRHLMEEDR